MIFFPIVITTTKNCTKVRSLFSLPPHRRIWLNRLNATSQSILVTHMTLYNLCTGGIITLLTDKETEAQRSQAVCPGFWPQPQCSGSLHCCALTGWWLVGGKAPLDGASRGGGLPGLRMSGLGRFPLSLHHGAPGGGSRTGTVWGWWVRRSWGSCCGTKHEWDRWGGAVSNTWTPGSLGAVVPLAEACCLLPPTPPPPLKPIHSLLPLPRLPEPLTPPFQVRAGL